jgi:hypothetical protein
MARPRDHANPGFPRLAALLLALTALPAALGQGVPIPPHAPGSICYTPQGWCWAVYPGPSGARCACSANGMWYQGVLV